MGEKTFLVGLRRVGLRASVTVVFGFCSWTCLGAEALPFNVPVLESIDRDRRVSGDALIGLVVLQPDRGEGFRSVHAHFSEFQGDLTLYIATIDGRYYAEIRYSVPELTNGWLALSLPETTLVWLNEEAYTQESVSLLLRSEASGQVIPLTWDTPILSGWVRAYINAERSAGFVVDRSQRVRIPCARPETTNMLIYNQICDFPTTAVSGQAVEIQRRDGIRVMSSIRFSVSKM